MSSSRIILTKLIRKHKNVLFAPFNSTSITKKVKEDIWEQIRQEAIAQGCSRLTTRTWKDVRDKCWAPIRRDFIQKRDRNKKSGSKGGAGALYPFNKLDILVQDILEKESAIVDGLDINDSEIVSTETEVSIATEDDVKIENDLEHLPRSNNQQNIEQEYQHTFTPGHLKLKRFYPSPTNEIKKRKIALLDLEIQIKQAELDGLIMENKMKAIRLLQIEAESEYLLQLPSEVFQPNKI